MSGMSPPEQDSYDGYARETRPAGVRNTVLVLPSVICSGAVAEQIAEAVPEATCAPHDHGCGQIGADKDQTRRTLTNAAANPNVAGVVVVGLGCETLDSEALAADLDLPVRQTAIQSAGGTDEAIEAGVAAVEELVSAGRTSRRTGTPLSELTVGVAISDLSESTVTMAASEVGRLVRAVTGAGGRVVVGNVETLVPHREHVSGLTDDGLTAERLRETIERHGETVPPTPIRTAAADHPIEAVTAFWDHRPLCDVREYGRRVTHDSGVGLVATAGRFEETATALAAAGAQVVVHVTADGIPTGHPIVPVLTVTGDPETVRALPEDIDVDAARSDGNTLSERVLATAGGEPTATEGHGLTTFAIARSGPSL